MRYWVVGYYGYGNTGDDDLLTQSIKLIRSIDRHATFTVAFPNKPKSPLPEGTKAMRRFSPLEILQTIWITDAVIFGGGGIFQDQTSIQSVIYYVGIVLLASIFRCPVFLIGQGISRPQRRLSRVLIKLALSRCHWIGCRDEESLAELRTLTSPTTGTLTADLAFAFRTPHLHPTHRPYYALSLRYPNQPINWTIIQEFIEQSDYPIIALSLESPQDDNATKNAFETTSKPIPTIVPLQNQFPNAALDLGIPACVVAMRYHACIWAALNGIPFIALAYDDKVIAIAKELDQPFIDLRTVSKSSNILTEIGIAMNNYALTQQRLLSNVTQLCKRATKNIEGLDHYITTR